MRATKEGVVCVVRERKGSNSAGQGYADTDDRSEDGVHSAPDSVGISRNLLDSLNDAIYVVDEEEDVVWNRQLNTQLGYTDEEIAEMNLTDFLLEEYCEISGEGMDMVNIPDRTREMDLIAKDGDHIPHEFRDVTYTNEVSGEQYRVGIARDITEEQERERTLKHYETILETVQDGVYVLDEDFRFSFVKAQDFIQVVLEDSTDCYAPL